MSVDAQSDTFAYGCAVYQILTDKSIFSEVVDRADRDKVARCLRAESRFPDVGGLRLDRVALSRRPGDFNSMGDVIAALGSISGSRSALGEIVDEPAS